MAKYAHKLVAETAKEIAAAAYEDMARDNNFYRLWPKQKIFVAKHYKNFIRPARECLARMLGMDKFSEETKDEILQALLLDRALPPNGDTSVQVPTKNLIH